MLEENKPLITRDLPAIEQGFELSETDYQWNLFKMVIIWTSTIFSSYLIMFQLKYLKGNIFHNTNSYAFSDAISRVFGGLFFANYGLKKSLVLAYTISMVGGLGIYFIQSNYLEYYKSYPQIAFLIQNVDINSLMPRLLMVTKFGIGAASLASYSACFSDDTIFPASKRVTAIGICNIVARALTILAPLVNEARVPLPMLSFIAAISIALIFSFSFR